MAGTDKKVAMNHDKISKALESICNQGCTVVNNVIDAMENGVQPDETSDLSAKERDALLEELKKIMSIYNRKHS